jgi:hypothetical protein
LGSVNADTVTITRRGTATVVQHPRRQARGYMLRLMDECRRHSQAGMLMQKEGRHAGGYAFPFCHIAVLSNINRSQIAREAQELALLFPPGTTITRDELATWETLEPQALLARLNACFDPWWAFPKLTPVQRSPRARLNVRAWHLCPFETTRHGRNTPKADGAIMVKLTHSDHR